jgi:hypothetical protein
VRPGSVPVFWFYKTTVLVDGAPALRIEIFASVDSIISAHAKPVFLSSLHLKIPR